MPRTNLLPPARRGMVAVVAAVGLAVAGCGGEDGATGSSDVRADTAAATTIYDDLTQRPEAIDFDVPIDAPIPTDQSVYYIPCGTGFCDAEAEVIEGATDKLGWDFEMLSSNGSPEQVQAAWEKVLADKPDAVIYNATPRSLIDRYIKSANDLGITVVARSIAEETGDGVTWSISGPKDVAALSEPMAAMVVHDMAESDNVGAGVVYLNLPELPILTTMREQIEKNFETFCESCPFDAIDFGLGDLGTVPDQVVSFLRSHPDTKYVVLSADTPFGAVPAALKGAGLTDVKVFGEGSDASGFSMIENGDITASVAYPLYEAVYGMVDAIARVKAGVPVEAPFVAPFWILTKDNLPTSSEFFPLVPDVEEHFAQLWGKS